MGNIIFKKSVPKENDSLNISKDDKWKIIIADDEESIHAITKMVTKNISFKEKTVEFISAFSGKEALETLKSNPDTALILLDVVMESEDAGLVTTEKIRNELNNKNVRIILRTGQPGQAPENQVISKYDINDYKLKTEITSQNLCTAIVCSLRAFNELYNLEKNKIGLEKIVEIAETIICDAPEAIKQFSNGFLIQLLSLLSLNNKELSSEIEGGCYLLFSNERKKLAVLGIQGDDTFSFVPEKELLQSEKFILKNNEFYGVIRLDMEKSIMFFIKGNWILKDTDYSLINIFINNIKNIYLTLFSKYYSNSCECK